MCMTNENMNASMAKLKKLVGIGIIAYGFSCNCLRFYDGVDHLGLAIAPPPDDRQPRYLQHTTLPQANHYGNAHCEQAQTISYN